MPQNIHSLFVAIELSKSQWTLCFGDGRHLRRRTIAAGDCAALLREIQLTGQKSGLAEEAPVHSCHEAGRDGFWLHRFLVQRQVKNRVLDSASIEVNRRQKHQKTDRVDAEKLLGLWRRLVLFGERRVCAVVRGPASSKKPLCAWAGNGSDWSRNAPPTGLGCVRYCNCWAFASKV